MFKVLMRFNSIKVRLRPLTDEGLTINITGFNSIKVRLRLQQPSLTTVCLTLFQFDKGTIKTKWCMVAI